VRNTSTGRQAGNLKRETNMATYQVLTGGWVVLEFSANFSEASSPVRLVTGDSDDSTPFQVADFSHSPVAAARGLNRWCRSQGGEAWARGETGLVLRTRR